MGYTRLNLPNGVVLEADHLKHLEDGINSAVNTAESLASDAPAEDLVITIPAHTGTEVVSTTDITSLFEFDFTTSKGYDASIGAKSSTFMTFTTVDVSAYAGHAIEMSLPHFTSSGGGASGFVNCVLDADENELLQIPLPAVDGATGLAGALGSITFTVPGDAKYLVAHMFNNNAIVDASTVSSNYAEGLIVYEGKLTDFYANYLEKATATVEESTFSVSSPGVGYTLISLDHDEICDYYGINSSGNAELATGYGCTSFIDCKGSPKMAITKMQGTSEIPYGIAFYDESKAFLSYLPSIVGDYTGSKMTEVEIPDDAAYFKATWFDYESAKEYGMWQCYLYIKSNLYGYGKYRPYQDGYIWFSQAVNQAIPKVWETSSTDVAIDANFKSTTGVLALPESYSTTGKKTPLILYCHGTSHYVYYGAWGARETFRTQKQHWLDMGFAVMDVNGARNNDRKGTFQTGFCYQGIRAMKQCVDYVTSHYNVDSQIYVIGGSGGGASGMNYARFYPAETKALVNISGWAKLNRDCFQMYGPTLYVEYLGFTDGTTYEPDKAIGLDPWDSIVTINDVEYAFSPTMPILFCYGTEDTLDYLPITEQYMQALRNAGLPVQTKVYEGLGHEIVSGAIENVDTDIGNWLLMH